LKYLFLRTTFLLNTVVKCFDKDFDEPESSSDILKSESAVENKPKVKITRKSPYVAGTSSGAILKGTPKPSVNIRYVFILIKS